MAKFTIYSALGVAIFSGTPTFTGTYMKPGMLEFREIASPTLINFTAGDYVVYSRTGLTYRIYNVPQLKKQSRSATYGGAFVYQSVQLFDDSKQLEICPFRDLVAGDNRIHFSTQPSISTFEGVDGIARRIQACLDDMYPGQWLVRLATTAMGASQDLVDLMSEARDFTVSGVSLLGALDKVYEVWPDVGWVFTRENLGTVASPNWKNIITIGGGGLTSTSSYLYGKGNGLTSITRTVANVEELANRLFVYGSSRNMLPRWYNSQNIKDAESVDIQNLMIPVSEWGLTDVDGTDLPDASKAYVEDATSIARLGLRPKTYYFDGTGDLPEIYPTIREATIKAVRDALGSSSAQYYPSTTVYTNENVRVDRILSAPASFDSGLAGETPGRANVESDLLTMSSSGSFTMLAGTTYYPFYHYQGEWQPDSTGYLSVSSFLDLVGSVQLQGIESCVVSVKVKDPSYQGPVIFGCEYELTPDADGVVHLSGQDLAGAKVNVQNVGYYVNIDIAVKMTAQVSDKTGTYTISGNVGFSIQNSRAKTFKIGIRQLGFNITDQALLGDGKTIAMRSGKCAGRTFVIKSCVYVEGTDSWSLECYRSEDESLSQWFPNTDYPVRGLENAGQSNEYLGDEFVLLDIAMPDIYVRMAENKLYQAAQDLLLDTATERWQYTPDIDAKFMVENSRTIVAGQNMALQDADIIGSSAVNILVDSLTINEGESAIPTYKVTLRDRKRKTWTESESAPSTSSKSVSNATQDAVAQMSSAVGETFFMLDDNGNVTLKEPYQNLWVPGWLSAGGVGTGGGGGGSVTYLNDLSDVTAPNPGNGDLLTWDASANSNQGAWVNVARNQVGTPVSLTNGATYSTLTVNSVTADFYTKSQTDSLLANIDLSDYVTNTALATTLASYVTQSALTTALADYATKAELAEVNTLVDITTLQDGILKFEWQNGDIVNVDLNHEHSNYVPVTTTINGVDLSQSRTFYTLGTAISGTQATGNMLGVTGLCSPTSWASGDTDKSQIVWDSDRNAWRFKGNLYADGWIAAGGIGNSSGGGGGVSSFYDLPEIDIPSGTTITANQILTYDGTAWVNQDLQVVVDDTIPDGTTGYTRIATITINGGSPIHINAPADGGGGGGGGVETDPIFSASVAYGITSADITSWNGKLSGVRMNGSTVTPSNGVVDLGTVLTAVPDLSSTYVTITGTQTITGAKTFTSNLSVNAAISVNGISTIEQNTTDHLALFNYGGRLTSALNAYGTTINLRVFNASEQANILSVQTDRITVGSQLIPNYTTGINLGGSSANQRWSTIYGLNANLTGNLVMSSTSYIDLGPVRIEYDSVNKAIHVKKADSNDSNEYGFYCDGFVAAGGVQASS